MKKAIFLFLVILVFNHQDAEAKFKNTCSNLKKIKLALSVHGSNYANAFSTKTPEGGPYKPLELICDQGCTVKSVNRVNMQYEPTHPNATDKGFVKYPEIDREREKKAILSYIRALGFIAETCENDLSIVKESKITTVNYKNGFLVSDTFEYSENEALTSWVRKMKNGKSIQYVF